MGSLRKKTSTKPVPTNAELFERKGERFARWVDGRGKKKTAKLTTGHDGSERIVVEGGTYTAKYRAPDGTTHEVATGCRDRGAAQAVLNELERRSELVKANVMTAGESSIADHASTSLVNHFASYRDHRIAKGLSEVRIANTDSRLTRLADECGFRRLADLSADAITGWLRQHLDAGMSPGTRNEYRQELVGFGNWCIQTRRLSGNPFTDVPRANAKADRRRHRRALTEPEIDRLLFVTRWRPLAEFGRQTVPGKSRKRSNWKAEPLTYDGLEAAVRLSRERLAKNPDFIRKLEERGRERALIYRTLILTGLRRGELASLTMGSLELDDATPYATLKAGDEKNRQGSGIPLRADLAKELRQWVADRRNGFTGSPAAFSNEPLFSVPASLVKVLNRDLDTAGIAKADERGRTVDVHSLRMTFATLLSKGGVSPKVAQMAMRHSDIRLTMETYTDPKLFDVAGALDALPAFSHTQPSDSPEVIRATGTDSLSAPVSAPGTVQTGQTESSAVILTGNFGSRQFDQSTTGNTSKPKEKAPSEANSDRASGVETMGLEPTTSALRTQR